MTAAMLVLERIFEADLALAIYPYCAVRNAHQAVAEVEISCFKAAPMSWTPTWAVNEEHQPCGGDHPHAHPGKADMAGCHNAGGQDEPRCADGKLLFCWYHEQDVPRDR
jgi:hypothetical protein